MALTPELTEMLGQLDALDARQLSILESMLVEAFDRADNAGDVHAMEELADALDSVRAYLDTNPPTADQVAAAGNGARRSAAAGLIESMRAEMARTGRLTTPNSTHQKNQKNQPREAAVANGENEIHRGDVPSTHSPVAAAGRGRQAWALSATELPTIRVGGDVPGMSAGSPLRDMDEVIDALVRRVNTMRRVSGSEHHGEHVLVASVKLEGEIGDNEHKTLRTGDLDGNSRKIRNFLTDRDALTPEGLVAAGWCAPMLPLYEVPTMGTTERPVRASLPSFGAERGGVTWMAPPSMSAFTGGISDWRYFAVPDVVGEAGSWGSWIGPGLPAPDQQEPAEFPPAVAPTAGATGNVKPCVSVPCGTEQSATLTATSVCLCFDNLTARAFPEWIRANTELSLVAQARYAESSLLGQLFAFADTVGTAAPAVSYGASRDFLAQVRGSAAQFRWANRLGLTAPLQLLVPGWLKYAIATDLSIQAPGDDKLSTAYAEIDGYLSDIHVQPIWYIDEIPLGTPGVAAIDPFDTYDSYPTVANWLLFPTGALTLLDGGELDLGVVRTKDDIARNTYCTFVETFEAAAYLGPAAPNGWLIKGATAVTITGATACCP